jgi:hypothetical protein
VFADPAQIDLHDATLEAIITGKPAALVINLDETRHQAGADAHKEFVIDLATFLGTTVSIPVDRSEKMAMLLAAIAANGKKLESLVIISRVTVEKERMHLGYGEECVLQYQENWFVTTELFDYWCKRYCFRTARRRGQN